MDDYIPISIIGTGSYGKVKLVKDKKNQDKFFATKMLIKSELIRLKQVDHMKNELSILSMPVAHPFVVNFNGFGQDASTIYFMFEFIQGGELFALLRAYLNFNLEYTTFYSSQIVSVFEFMHSKSIDYRDLKPENILINYTGYLKICDFGFAKKLDKSGITYTLCGTPEYLAPEIILSKGHSFPVDWWTLGIFLYECLVGIDPFNDDDPMTIYKKIIKGKFNFPNDIDKEAKSLIKHLLVADTTKRYGCLKDGVKDIKDHNFFKKLNWDNLMNMSIKPPFIPKIQNAQDTSNFNKYPDSGSKPPVIKNTMDPFLNW